MSLHVLFADFLFFVLEGGSNNPDRFI